MFMNGEKLRIKEEEILAHFKEISCILLERLRKPQKPSFRIVDKSSRPTY
jgi:hypothetical protein